jgi:hypothetical protein
MADIEMGDAVPAAKASKATDAVEKRPRFEIKKVSCFQLRFCPQP